MTDFSLYADTSATARRWGVSNDVVRNLLRAGRVPGAINPAGRWLIPRSATRPERDDGFRTHFPLQKGGDE